MKHTRADLKRGMWIFLGNKILEGDHHTIQESRLRLFDYRLSPLNSAELQWYSQARNPYKFTPHQITKMSPLTCKFRGSGSDYYIQTFRLKEVSHSFETHTDFITWRNETLVDERETIRTLHQEIRRDRRFWKNRRAELRMWNRIDDLKKVRKIK